MIDQSWKENTLDSEKIKCAMFSGYTEATQAMVSAMREVGVKRLVLCHSWYTEEASRSQAMFLIR